MALHYKIGFIGAGNMTQAIIRGLLEAQALTSSHIFASNRSPGKLQKVTDTWKINALSTNEAVVDAADIIILAMKPQDMNTALDPLISAFRDKQVVISLAAGVPLATLEKKLPNCRIVRAMPNTPAILRKGVTGYLTSEPDPGLESLTEDIFSPLGTVLQVGDEEQLDALMISCSSGVGFVYELMMYFQDWIEERGFDTQTARKMVVETFLGASALAVQQKDQPLEELQSKVTSKKGVTAAGLESMRELEIERLLRYSFEKAALRNQELAKQT
ncbi:MAG: pyrroline-5-carboxylate reductase [Oligoflexia bacterium]|nr:MAG: pyrroline-5-carboxylate reductase [Oligoflexia bacterium]